MPSAVAQAIATAQGNGLAALSPPLTGLQSAISGGSLAPAAMVDAYASISYTEVLGGVGFQNGWVNFGSVNDTAGFLKDACGIVHLKGTVKSGTGPTIFTLPSGFLPAAFRAFPVVSNNLFGIVSIDSSGNVALSAGSNAFVFLDPISFYATH